MVAKKRRRTVRSRGGEERRTVAREERRAPIRAGRTGAPRRVRDASPGKEDTRADRRQKRARAERLRKAREQKARERKARETKISETKAAETEARETKTPKRRAPETKSLKVALPAPLHRELHKRAAQSGRSVDNLVADAVTQMLAGDAERGDVITLSSEVLFKVGESEVIPAARQELDKVAASLKEKEGQIIVEGFTDSRGSRRVNQQLSQARADAVRAYLVEKGLSADRIVAIGKGESNPIASNRSGAGRAKNRRVEIVVKQR